MSFEINDDFFPYSAATYILSRWGEYVTTGSGFIVGKNDVLTAAHVIFDSTRGGLADEILVYPSYDPNDISNDFYSPVDIKYYDNFDPNGDGYILPGDNNISSLAGTEIDIAHLKFEENLESKYGSFGVDTDFSIGEVSVVGYPVKFNFSPIFDNGNIVKDLIDDYFSYSNLELSSGNSGGPIYYDNGQGPYAVGIVSTDSAILSLSGQKNWLHTNLGTSEISFQKPYMSIVSNMSHVDEGQEIKFSVNFNKEYFSNQINFHYEGLEESDIFSGLTKGVLEHDSSGSASLSLVIASDFKTEGPELLTLNIDGTTYQVFVNDTSKKIEDNSVIYFTGNGLTESFVQSEIQNFFRGESYGYSNFSSVGRLEEWIGSNLIYSDVSFYPISGTLNYISALFDDNSSFIAASGSINIDELPIDYTLSNVFNSFVENGPNQVLGSDGVDVMAAFTDGDFVDGYLGTDTFLLSSEKSAYKFYDLDLSTHTGKIDKGQDITISFDNIENFEFSDQSQTFEDLVKEKMLSISTLSDLVPTNLDNSSGSQYIKSSVNNKTYYYDELSSNVNFNYVDIDNKICSLNSYSFGTDTLSGFERIIFLDSTLALDLGQGETTGQIYRLYNAAFSREPDLEGLNYYISKIEDSNYSIQSIAMNFLNSPEFNIRHGTNLPANDFVTTFYKNVLNREASTDELLWYETRLENDSFSRVDVLLGFSESPENIFLTTTLIDDGIWLN